MSIRVFVAVTRFRILNLCNLEKYKRLIKEMTKACPVFTLYIEFYSLYPIIMYINIYIYIYIYNTIHYYILLV